MSSYAPTAAVTAAIVAAAAQKRRQEEEDMTRYDAEDLNGWEFKIVRSALERFSSYENVQKLCQEESAAGWEMVEKFDNGRIRFKRRIENRSQDSHRAIDPYRSQFSLGAGALAWAIVGFTVLLVGLVILFVSR